MFTLRGWAACGIIQAAPLQATPGMLWAASLPPVRLLTNWCCFSPLHRPAMSKGAGRTRTSNPPGSAGDSSFGSLSLLSYCAMEGVLLPATPKPLSWPGCHPLTLRPRLMGCFTTVCGWRLSQGPRLVLPSLQLHEKVDDFLPYPLQFVGVPTTFCLGLDPT